MPSAEKQVLVAPDSALWRLPTVLAHIPVSRSGWWAGVKEGRYPAPVKLSTRCVAWRSADIRALIASF
jgi:predicted DNA-binding transcriptional regulator AlpA